MTFQTAPTVQITVVMAGDIEQAKQCCREYCFEVGLCVTIEPTLFIYTGGEERGFRVGLINYPRFPASVEDIKAKALALAERLMQRLCQHSYSVITPTETLWFSRRPA